MSVKTVTVFGGSGFLGRFVVRALLAAGHPVRVATRRRPGQQTTTAEWLRADVRDDTSVRTAVAGSEGVVNVVGLYTERGAETFDAVHVAGAATVAREARAAGVERLVHVSGIGADPGSPSRYVRARALGEQRVREAFPNATILRPSVLFGPGDAFLNLFDRITAVAPVFPLIGSGDTRLQPVYAGDVAQAALVALQRPDAAGLTYELGGPRAWRYREIVELILRHRGRRRWLLPIPMPLWQLLATLLSVLPSPPITRDQLALLRQDNVVDPQAPSFPALGLSPQPLDTLLAECLR